MIRRSLLASALIALLLPLPATPQAPGHTPGPWRKVGTEHFLFLYPEELAEWTLDVARSMESVHEAVTGLIGYTPARRVTVLVDDPGNVSNGSTNPGPLLYVWPTPPDPRSMVGENRGWGEILAVHEYAHAVHLTRPTRNPARRFLWKLAPIPVTPMMAGTPRWLTEGYATWVEGVLTGSGRPHGVWRPAILRTWALEGQIPTYGAVSGTGGYLGGAMAYLVGSAFVEWLLDREGPGYEVLPDLWARMTARETRSFPQAFQGVFGRPPEELYGLFTVDVVDRALAVRREVETAGGVVEGQLFQRLEGTPGDPSVSPDSRHMVLSLSPPDCASRIVVISTTPDTVSTRERERLEAIFRRDPEDVRPVARLPRAQKPSATLWPDFGSAYTRPRWLPDGKGILLTRDVLATNGRLRPELFLWEWETGKVRQITRGQAVREADPAPDGSWAAGLRCLEGRCNLVRVELATGVVTTLARSDLHGPYAQPRVSPDGRTIVAGRQVDGLWRVVAMAADGSGERILGPRDGAARFDAAFLPGGRTLVLTSTRGGIPNLEILELETGQVRPLTRVLGAAAGAAPVPAPMPVPAPVPAAGPASLSRAEAMPMADPGAETGAGMSRPAGLPTPAGPSPAPSSDLFFLSLHSRGWDLRRIALAGAASDRAPLDPGLAPAAPAGLVPAPAFAEGPLGEIRSYGAGPRLRSWWPVVSLSEEGYAGGVVLSGSDPIGRLTGQLRGMWGGEEAWRGAALGILGRGSRASLLLEGFVADGPLPRTAGLPAPASSRSPWEGYHGVLGALETRRDRDRGSLSARVGGSAGRLEDRERTLGFASLGLAARQSPGRLQVRESVELQAAGGRTSGEGWNRWSVTGALEAGGESIGLLFSGALAGSDAPADSPEALQVGGTQPLLFDPALLSQRIPMPALPAGLLRGERVATATAELRSELLGGLFFWAGNAEGDGLGWYRMVGTRTALEAGPLPYLRLPAVTFEVGNAYLLDHPGKGTWRWWMVLGWRP